MFFFSAHSMRNACAYTISYIYTFKKKSRNLLLRYVFFNLHSFVFARWIYSTFLSLPVCACVCSVFLILSYNKYFHESIWKRYHHLTLIQLTDQPSNWMDFITVSILYISFISLCVQLFFFIIGVFCHIQQYGRKKITSQAIRHIIASWKFNRIAIFVLFHFGICCIHEA